MEASDNLVVSNCQTFSRISSKFLIFFVVAQKMYELSGLPVNKNTLFIRKSTKKLCQRCRIEISRFLWFSKEINNSAVQCVCQILQTFEARRCFSLAPCEITIAAQFLFSLQALLETFPTPYGAEKLPVQLSVSKNWAALSPHPPPVIQAKSLSGPSGIDIYQKE